MKQKIAAVYQIIHNPTGMTYVGYSKDVESRITSHKSRLRRKKFDAEFYRFWSTTDGKDWVWQIVNISPKDPKSAEIESIKTVPEHLRLNMIQFVYPMRINKTPVEISNRIRKLVESKNSNKTGYPGVTLQKNGRFKYKISWPGKKIKERGFNTALEAHEARVKTLRELNDSQTA